MGGPFAKRNGEYVRRARPSFTTRPFFFSRLPPLVLPRSSSESWLKPLKDARLEFRDIGFGLTSFSLPGDATGCFVVG